MGFIGQPLNAGNLSVDVFTGNGSTTVFALTYSVGSSESVAIYLDGVKQAVSTYTASGTVLTFTTAPPNGVGIEVVFLALTLNLPTPGDGTVDETKLKDALIADFTEVVVTASDSILLGDATDSGNTKRDTVQGILDLAGGNLVLIGTAVASTSASLTVTGLDSTYDTYAIVMSDLVPATDADNAWLRCGDSGGVDSGATDYEYHFNAPNSGASTYNGVNSAGAAQLLITGNTGSAAGEGVCGTIYLGRPADGSAYPMFYGMLTFRDQTAVPKGSIFNGERSAVITLDRIQFLFSTGNIASGRLSVYGIKHA